MKRNCDKLCIIGSTPSKRDAPYMDDEYDIWAISSAAYSESLGSNKIDASTNHWNDVHRIDCLFEMHKEYQDRAGIIFASQLPVVMLKADPLIPLSEAYPVDEIAKNVGDEFTSSVAYMMAYAIHLGYKEINLYGINMAHQSEYAHQRGGVKYYAAVARERSIVFKAPPESQLSECRQRYGYDDYDVVCYIVEKRKDDLKSDIEKQKLIVEAANRTLWQLQGALIDCDDLILTIKGGIA